MSLELTFTNQEDTVGGWDLFLVSCSAWRGSAGLVSGQRLWGEDHPEVERTSADLRDHHSVRGTTNGAVTDATHPYRIGSSTFSVLCPPAPVWHLNCLWSKPGAYITTRSWVNVDTGLRRAWCRSSMESWIIETVTLYIHVHIEPRQLPVVEILQPFPQIDSPSVVPSLLTPDILTMLAIIHRLDPHPRRADWK